MQEYAFSLSFDADNKVHTEREGLFIRILFFRMSQQSVLNLADMLRATVEEGRCNIPVEMQLLIALRFYAQGSYQQSVAQDCFYPVSQPLVSVVITSITEAICSDLTHRYIHFPNTAEERLRTQDGYIQSHLY